ncbi:MAG TPA: hypothetical protein VGG19_12490 [Tepidisphaeraceae bacterium]
MKTTKYLLAATLAVSGMSLCTTVQADDTTSTQTQTTTNDQNNTATEQTNDRVTTTEQKDAGNTDNMAGVQDTHSINSVREQVREITNDALTKNDLEAIRNRLTVDDQKRLGDLGKLDSDDLNMLVKDIDQKWKDKYNHKFDVNTKMALAEPFVRIDSINKAQVASSNGKTEDREVANVTLASDNKLPELNLTMVREHMSWKLQLPASVDGPTLKNNLVAQLQALNNDSANWPADENEAYRCVTHRVMMGISGMSGNNAQPASATNMP